MEQGDQLDGMLLTSEADPRERGPAISLHSKEAAINKAEHEGGVSVDVDSPRGPGREGH